MKLDKKARHRLETEEVKKAATKFCGLFGEPFAIDENGIIYIRKSEGDTAGEEVNIAELKIRKDKDD